MNPPVAAGREITRKVFSFWNKSIYEWIISVRLYMRYKIMAALAVLSIGSIIAAAMRAKVPAIDEVIVETSATPKKGASATEKFDGVKLVRSNEEWKKLLTPEQFYILREKGTEKPYSGEYDRSKRVGTYHCAACDLALFRSKAKFDSETGWPSFYEPIYKQNVHEEEDRSLGEVRTEVLCHRCGGHLGHVFDDGPQPTGLRYCMNSAALKFKLAK